MNIRIHTIIPSSTVNGPGNRCVIWLQGCEKNCPGCFNPATHPLHGGDAMSVDDIEAYITTIHNLEGISISGGEPFYQSAALNNLLERIKQRGLSVLLFTGYTIEEIHQDPDKASLLPFIDILIDGPFDESKKTNGPLLSSANQRMFFLTNRYTLLDIPAGNMEYIIDPTGTIIATGCAAP